MRDGSLLVYDAMLIGKELPTFRTNLPPTDEMPSPISWYPEHACSTLLIKAVKYQLIRRRIPEHMNVH